VVARLDDISEIVNNHCSNLIFIEEFEDIKGVIRIRISKKNRQHNGQMKKYKRTNNDLQTKHTHKTNDRVTRTPLKTGGELRCSGRVSSSSSTSGTGRVNLVTNPLTNIVSGPASLQNIPVMYAFLYTDIPVCLDTKSVWTDRQMDVIPLYPQSLFVGV
jgi:hypothetical protein